MRTAGKLLLFYAATAASLVFFVAFGIPGGGAMVCPWCFGFEHFQDRIYVESAASSPQRRDVLAAVQASRRQVGNFFGAAQSRPWIFYCVTERCYARSERRGGSTLAISFIDMAIVLSSRMEPQVALTHELTHTELHNRLGPRMTAVPSWFDEGLAVYLSDDRRYLAPAEFRPRCLSEPAGALPVTGSGWVKATAATSEPYGQAACAVSRWIDGRGSDAVLQLIARIKSGASFADVYREPAVDG